MLYAKINPKASFVKQEGPFTAPVTIEAEFLTALARPYIPGATQTNFEVQFGNAVLNEEGVVVGINNVSNSNVVLTAVELVNWGVDDSVLLEAVAAKLGTSVESVIDVAGNQY
jgi:hypothetical protein